MTSLTPDHLWQLAAVIGGKLVLSPWCFDRYEAPVRLNAQGNVVVRLHKVNETDWRPTHADGYGAFEVIEKDSIESVMAAVDSLLASRGYILATGETD